MAKRSSQKKAKTAAWQDVLGPVLPDISAHGSFGSFIGPKQHPVDIVLGTQKPAVSSTENSSKLETPPEAPPQRKDSDKLVAAKPSHQMHKESASSSIATGQASLRVTDAELEKYKKMVLYVKKNPWVFSEKTFGVELWAKQKEIFESVWENRYTAVKSCFASGKSFVAAAIALAFAHLNKDSIVVITAPTDRQLRWGVMQNIARMYEMAQAELGSELLTREVRLGPGWYVTAFATDDPGNIQGLHPPSGKLLLIVDESGAVKAPIQKRLDEALMTSSGARRLDIGNPLDPEGPFFEMFRNPNYNKLTISAFDTPNLRYKDPAKQVPGLIDRVYVEERRREWGEDSPMWKSRILGEFPDSAEDTLIPLSWVTAAQERWKDFVELGKEEKLKRGIDLVPFYGLDVSRGGENETVLVLRDGNYVYPAHIWSNATTTQTARKVAELVPSGVTVNIDDVGIGGGVTDQAPVVGFKGRGINVSMPATDERFVNLRAQYYWALRDALNPEKTFQLALPPDDILAGQLTSIKYKMNAAGKIQIESKEDMRRRGMKSPDRADALMLTFATNMHGADVAPVMVGVAEGDVDARYIKDGGFGLSSILGDNDAFDSWGDMAAI